MKKLLTFFLSLFLLIILLLFLTDNTYIFRGITLTYLKGNKTANIYDGKDFDYNIIEKGDAINWEKDSLYNKRTLTQNLKNQLETNKTVAFLIIKNNKIITEKYWEDLNKNTQTNSFSMAKSITTLLVQKAIEDGYIKSWDEPITNYIPEYKNDSFANQCTLADLSKMTSGFDWEEDYYFPLNPTAKAYYGNNMNRVILKRSFITKPNSSFKYLSGNTQLLGYALKNALKMPLAAYLSKSFWKPLGMEQNANWTVDHKEGIEKTYCCIHSNARDFAKFGALLLNNGNFNNTQIIDSSFIKKMISPHSLSNGQYGYSIWTEIVHKPNFYLLKGHLGQYVIVVPSEKMIIVRLGEKRGTKLSEKENENMLEEIYTYVDEALKMN